MGPPAPNLDFSRRQSPPSSPPETPTIGTFSPTFGTFRSGRKNNQKTRRRSTLTFSRPVPVSTSESEHGGIGYQFSYNPYNTFSDEIPSTRSPYLDSTPSPPQSRSPSVYTRSGTPDTSPPERSQYKHIRIVPHTDRSNLIIREFSQEEEHEISDDDVSVIHPSHYESAHPSRDTSCVRSSVSRSPSRPVSSQDTYRDTARTPSPPRPLQTAAPQRSARNSYDPLASGLDPRTLTEQLESLDCGESDVEEAARQAWKAEKRRKDRRKRMSTGSLRKRNLAESIGSDTDDEDLELPMPEGMEKCTEDGQPGVIRRLRRKTNESIGTGMSTPRTPTTGIFAGLLNGITMGRAGDRSSLIYDPPPMMGVLTEVAGEDDDLESVIDRGVEVPDVDDSIDVDVFVRELRGYFGGNEAMDIDSSVGDDEDVEEEQSDDED